MTKQPDREIAQLRKEINELRERVAALEARQTYPAPVQPLTVPTWPAPPYTITCGGSE